MNLSDEKKVQIITLAVVFFSIILVLVSNHTDLLNADSGSWVSMVASLMYLLAVVAIAIITLKRPKK